MSGGDRDARWTCVVGPVVVVFFIIAPLTLLLPSSWTALFVQYLPSTAGAGLFSGTLGVENPLPPWTGFAVMCAYAVVLIGLAAWRPHFAGLETDTAPLSVDDRTPQGRRQDLDTAFADCVHTVATAGTPYRRGAQHDLPDSARDR